MKYALLFSIILRFIQGCITTIDNFIDMDDMVHADTCGHIQKSDLGV